MILDSFKVPEYFFNPAGLWITVRPEIGKPVWVVKAYNFATWKHWRREYDTEAGARNAADLWRL